jgi:ABC-type nitrate/sulfonate/bicarbonate transport system permease component
MKQLLFFYLFVDYYHRLSGNCGAASIGAKKMSQENRTVRWFYHSIPFIILFLLWEIVARVIHNPYILPPFSAVVASAFSPSLAYPLGITLAFSLLALLIVSLVGLPVGQLMHRFKEAEWVLSPLFWFLLFAVGLGTTGIAPILIMLFGLSQLTVLLFSILIPFLVVALISCYGAKLTAVRVGFLLCWSLQIIAGYQISVAGLGTQLSIFYHLHNLEMVYAIMLIMGFTGLFVDSVLKYMGNKIKER